jgi:hypothetical protein
MTSRELSNEFEKPELDFDQLGTFFQQSFIMVNDLASKEESKTQDLSNHCEIISLGN